MSFLEIHFVFYRVSSHENQIHVPYLNKNFLAAKFHDFHQKGDKGKNKLKTSAKTSWSFYDKLTFDFRKNTTANEL